MPHMSAQPRTRVPRLGVLMTFCVLAAAAGCASTTPSSATSAAAGNSASAGPPSQSATASSSAAPNTVQLAFADSGKTITVHVGGTIHVALNSTYWTFQPVAAPQLLKLDSTAMVPPSPGTCAHQVPGSGCGTQTADYTALATGQTSVAATRVNCGEAMRCTGSNGHFEVQIVIVN
jgi:hypothetical protein